MKRLFLAVVVIITTSARAEEKPSCVDPILFVEPGYGVVKSYCPPPRRELIEIFYLWEGSRNQQLWENYFLEERFYLQVSIELEFEESDLELSAGYFKEELEKDVDFLDPYEFRHKIGRPRPPKDSDPERWDYWRFANSNNIRGWGAVLLGGQRSTGLDYREKSAVRRIIGRPFRNEHYELLAVRFSYRWGTSRKIRRLR